jgi:hypothetical protein
MASNLYKLFPVCETSQDFMTTSETYKKHMQNKLHVAKTRNQLRTNAPSAEEGRKHGNIKEFTKYRMSLIKKVK